MTRDRSEGWQWAKLSGHKNEDLVCQQFDNDDYCNEFTKRIGCGKIASADVGGLCETEVETVLDDYSKGKTDLVLSCQDDKQVNISIKKSLSGQVFLVTIDRFINGFEKQFDRKIPKNVKEAIRLFWGNSSKVENIIKQCGVKKDYELRKHRLVADTLKAYDNKLYDCLLKWFKVNIKEIVLLCFSCGLVKEQKFWADYVWYINMVGEHNVDRIIPINQLCEACYKKRNEIVYGNRGGGTTIQLPFGFVQWHSPQKSIPGCIQFHHKYNTISKILSR